LALILAFGDCLLLNTGYGRVSREVLGYFASKGHKVIQLAWNYTLPRMDVPNIKQTRFTDSNGIEQIKMEQQGVITLVPVHTQDQFGTGSIITYINGFKPDFVYNSNDYFTMKPLLEQRSIWTHSPTTIDYGIIDGPECARNYADIISAIDKPVVPSQYGFKQIVKYNKNSVYIPHGVDTQIYKPMDVKEQVKKELGLQDRFVYGCVNRNILRKMFPLLIRSFAELKYEQHLNDISLLLLTDPHDPAGHGLEHWLKFYGLTYNQKLGEPADVKFHPAYLNVLMNLSDDELARAYNGFDVMVTTSLSEGFGLSTIESQSCGIPVIACDHTANTELIKGHGWLYSTAKNCDGSPVIIPPNIPLNWITYGYEMIDTAALKIAMLDAYQHSNKIKEFGKRAREFALDYSWEKILPNWSKVIPD